MGEFVAALSNPAVPFLRYALIAGLLASAAFGIVGTYITARRITYLAGAIAHSVLAGIGVSVYLLEAHDVAWLSPLMGAMVAAIVAGLIIGFVSMYAREREDTVIGAVWSIGMAVGILFLARTPGYVDPMSYLFGNILILSGRELILIGALDVVVIAVGVLGYNQFQAVTFDEEFARVRGLKTSVYFIVLILMTALSIVLLTTIVGLIMVIALFTLPAAVGTMMAGRMWQVMLLATLLTMVFTTAGLGLSYRYDLPSGPTIIVFAGAAYLAAVTLKGLGRRLRR
ncbi:MAG: metal ABC transporter permease [Spirochaetaceae bacterium]